MKIEKRYWQWTEDLNETNFKLGIDIQQLIIKDLVQKSNNLQQYKGIDEVPWIIEVDNKNTIKSVSYRETFFSIRGEYIGNLNSEAFISKIDSLLKPVDKKYKGDKLYVVFRDSFLAIIKISRE